jgi:hypothetical protein
MYRPVALTSVCSKVMEHIFHSHIIKHMDKRIIRFLHFVPFRQQIWPPRAIVVSDWLMLKKSSPLKLLGQMEPNLAGSIYVRSSIKLLHLVHEETL